MPNEIRVAELALPWAAAMPDDDLHHFLNDLVSAAMHRWHHDPDVPDREVLALVERACAQWRIPGQGFRSDAEDADARLAEIRVRVQSATPGPWAANPGGHPGILTRAATGDILAVLGGCAQDEADADFIAHSRTDTGFLLDLLAERDEQIAYLLAAEPTLDDDQPGVPA